MRYFILVGGFIILLMSAFTNWNGFTIHGRVTDEAGNGMPNVIVQLKGATSATVTDKTGLFTLKVPYDSAVLVFSVVGYAVKEVSVTNDGKPVNISLHASNTSLQEVVVVGYGTQKKQSVTGSVTTIKAEELKSRRSKKSQKDRETRTAYAPRFKSSPPSASQKKRKAR